MNRLRNWLIKKQLDLFFYCYSKRMLHKIPIRMSDYLWRGLSIKQRFVLKVGKPLKGILTIKYKVY